MNAGFLIEGILFRYGSIPFTAAFAREGMADCCFLAGSVTYSRHFNGCTDTCIFRTQNYGILIYHTIGAFLGIIFGNIACMCVGIAASRAGAPRWFKLYSILLCTIGIGGLITLIAVPTLPPGIPERISVYTITLWQVSTGVFLLIVMLKQTPLKR